MRTAVLALIVVLLPSFAAAQSRALVRCTIRVIEPAFGTYDPLRPTPDLAAGRVELNCPDAGQAPLARITLSQGQSGNYLDRVMRAGREDLHYNLYADQARHQIAGDGTSGTVPLFSSGFGSGTGTAQRRKRAADPPLPVHGTPRNSMATFPFYGAIAPRQNVPADEYSDRIRAEVEF